MTSATAVQERRPPASETLFADTTSTQPWYRSSWCVDGLLVTLASLVITVVVFRVFSIPLNVPFRLSGDGYNALAITKTMHQTGGWMTDPRLGAPFGSRAFDFPSGTDNLNFLLLKASTMVFANPVVALNMFILGCFTLTSLAGWIGARLLGLRRLTAAVLGLVFGFAPFHFLRAPYHIFLANYVAVPFGCVLAFWLLSDRPPFYEDAARTKRSPLFRGRRTWFTIVAVALIASNGIYYAAFAVLLIGVAMVLGALNRQWRSVRSGAIVVAGVGLGAALNLIPSLLFMWRHGHNPMVAQRSNVEIDAFGLHLVQLVSPVPGHRLAPLASLAQALQPTDGTESGSWLGLVALVGLVIALGAVARRVIGQRGAGDDLPAKAGLFALVCMLVGSVSGFAWLIGITTSSEIRSWARVSIVISFLALVALGAFVDKVAPSWARRPWVSSRRIALSAFGAIAVVIVAVADQAPRSIVPDSSVNAEQWSITDRFVHSIESTLDPGAMVFQLPVVAHPEYENRNKLEDYQLYDGFIHSDRLKWSFGAFQGREGDWQFIVERLPAPQLLDGIAAAGFTGLYLDRFGYSDAEVEKSIAGAGVPATLVSEDDRLVFYDLRAYARARRADLGDAAWNRLRVDTLYPVTWWLTSGYLGRRSSNPMNTTVQMGSSYVVDFWNRGPKAAAGGRPVVVRVEARATGGRGQLQLSGGGHDVSATVGPAWTIVDLPLTLVDERTPVHFMTDAPVSEGTTRIEIDKIEVVETP